MSFAYPWALLALLIFPLLYWQARRRRAPLQPVVYSDIRLLVAAGRTGRARWAWLPRFLWLLAGTSMVIALARPQERNVRREIVAPGIDIVLALDMSTSMLANDFPPTRFAAAKAVIGRFVASRSTDRIALVVFAGRAYTQVPLTFDYAAVQQMLEALAVGQIEDGTAIGMGMVEAVNRLKVSDAKSKVIILLTDGVNNRGRVDPKTAGEIAKLKNVRVYTIGMGMRTGAARSLIEQALGVVPETVMNIELLQEIAEQTGGRYFEAANLQDLSQVYETIGALEKSEVKLNEYVTIHELYPRFLNLALLLFLAGWFLDLTWLRKLP
jgi:Ca-activated chloride channel family protein